MFMTLGRRVGPDTLAATARRFGLGASTGVDLPRESRGLVPTPAWKREKRRQPWFPGDTCQMAMGQGDLLVTPLQVARMVAAVANGGELVTPHLIAHIDGLPPAEQPRHPVRSLPVEDEVLAVVREGMAAVVSRGTARSIYSSKLPIAGKTGTAQNPHGSPHAWFAGFAPANNPQLVVVVLMEQGGHGGAVSAPIAKRVFEAALLPPASPAR
jgi:penicillin-binding protein 2